MRTRWEAGEGAARGDAGRAAIGTGCGREGPMSAGARPMIDRHAGFVRTAWLAAGAILAGIVGRRFNYDAFPPFGRQFRDPLVCGGLLPCQAIGGSGNPVR